MGNIIGEPFDDYVNKQINDRQNVQGNGYLGNRDNLTLSYLNSKTSWIKLTSGVVVTPDTLGNDRLKSIDLGNHPSFTGPDGSNTGLSSFFVLFNGTSDNAGTVFGGINLKTPTNIGDTILDKTAYGIGGNEFGIRPMPGIISAETRFRNKGAIRDGSVNIKAWNKNQLDIIDVLYLRLGFPMLLEYGHSIIVDKDGKIDTKPDFSVSNDFLSLKYKTDSEVLDAIEKKRKESAGNYDAMYGRVQNFDWAFNKDGSYDITLRLISVGAVIESFKINSYIQDSLSISKNKEDDSQTTPEKNFQWLTTYRFSHTIGNILYLAYQKTVEKGFTNSKIDFISTINKSELGKIGNLYKNYFSNNPDSIDYISIAANQTYGFTNFFNRNDAFYVRFEEFLRLLQISIPRSKDGIILQTNSTSDTKYMNTENFQLSGNYGVCLVGGFNIDAFGSESPIVTANLDLASSNESQLINVAPYLNSNPFKSSTNGVLVGNINNIYINTTFILSKMENLKDETNKVALITLLKEILTGINQALGGINQLDIHINETTNIISIIDQTPIPGIEKLYTTPGISTRLNIYGYSGSSSAGFVKDVSLKTEITNNLASLITIGATANKAVVGEDATAFSKWNSGLVPIINKTIDYDVDESSTVVNAKNKYDSFLKDNTELVNHYFSYLSHWGKDSAFLEGFKKVLGINTFSTDDNIQTVTNFLAYLKQEKVLRNIKNIESNPNTNKISTPNNKGFFPLNVSLTLDGLAGIKIFQQIQVDTPFLPSKYPDAMKFIVKGVSHKIDNNVWSTMLDTLAQSIPDLEENITNVVTPNQKSSGLPSGVINEDNLLNFKKFLYPVNGRITSKIIIEREINGRTSGPHRGIDIAAPKGAPVISTTDGKVVRIGGTGYGPNAVWIQIDYTFYNQSSGTATAQPRYIVYGHLDKATVAVGQSVKANQPIGTVGDKDSPGSYHLHFQIKSNIGADSAGTTSNINTWFPSKGQPIILGQNFVKRSQNDNFNS
jgi:hypothetical protein